MVVSADVLSATQTLAILADSIVAAQVVGDDLILTTRGGTVINAGYVRGAGSQTYFDHGSKAGNYTLDTNKAETNAITMTNDVNVTLSNGVNGKTVYIVAAGSYILTVQGMVIPTGKAVAIMSFGVWDVYIIGSSGDNVAPVAGTLSVTFPGTDGALVVAGAADYGVGLHASPYSFSKDNGTTWTAWQTSTNYSFASLSPSTSYTFMHRTRDAVGNISLGLPTTQTTPALKTWATLFSDTFATGTVLAGRTVETGTGSFVNDNATAVNIVGGAAVFDPTVGQAQYHVAFAAQQTRIRMTGNYDCSTHTTAGARSSVTLGVDTLGTWNNTINASIGTATSGNTADVQFIDNAAGTWTIAAAPGQALTGLPAAGKLEVDIDLGSGSGTVKVNDVTVGIITGDTTTVKAFGARINFQNSTSKLLDVTCERYA